LNNRGEQLMEAQTTYQRARDNFAKLCKRVAENREIVRITRPRGEDVALIAVAELEGLLETAHLLRSPKNAERLLAAIAQARAQIGEPQTVSELRREMGLEQET
jgi:antitoxin YefM